MQNTRRVLFILCVLLELTFLWIGMSFAFSRSTIDDLQNAVQIFIRQKNKGNSDAIKSLQRIAKILSKFDVKNYDQNEILNKIGNFIAKGTIPSYIFNGNRQYKYIKGNNILYLSGTNIHFRSAPNRRADIINTFNKEYTEYMTYLGEWTNPNKERWVLAIDTRDGNMNDKLGWIYGEYVKLVPNSTIKSILSEINNALSSHKDSAINTTRVVPLSPSTVETTPAENGFYTLSNLFQLVMDYGTLSLNGKILTLNETIEYTVYSWWKPVAVLGSIIGFFCESIGVVIGIVYAEISLVFLPIVVFWGWNYIIPFILNSAWQIILFTLIIAICYGTSTVIYKYFCSLVKNMNPYKYYVDTSEGAQKNVMRKSYFFGPGYVSVIKIIKEATENNIKVIKNIHKWIDKNSSGTFSFVTNILGWIYLAFTTVSIIVVGCSVTLLCSAVHLGFMSAVMVAVYILFTAIWTADRVALYRRRENSDCYKCYDRYIVPAFICPSCKSMHTRLVPSAYGIFHHICKCGRKLPCTFFNGRGELQAVCPRCSDEEHKFFIRLHSNVHPISIQLVGGTGAGKSAYLASAMTKLVESLSGIPVIKASETDEKKSELLRRIYSSGRSSRTLSKNAVAYSLKISSPSLKTDRLLSFYDIRGDFFMSSGHKEEVALGHLKYTDGFLFLIDASRMKNDSGNLGQEEIIANSLVNYMDGIGTKRQGGKFMTPFMFLFSKSDEEDELCDKFAEDSGISCNPEERDNICRNLIQKKSSNLLIIIESNFSKVHYYSVSTTGSKTNTQKEMNPWPNLLAPVHDIIRLSDKELAKVILP